jgi:hypothetical protein
VRQNPSFERFLNSEEFIQEVYGDAVLEAAEQTGLPEETSPAECPFTYDDFAIPQTCGTTCSR